MDTTYGAHPTHYKAADYYAAADAVLKARTGFHVTAAIAYYGSFDAMIEAHPDIAPGFAGFPFKVKEDNNG